MSSLTHSSAFINRFLIGICALTPDAPSVAALAYQELTDVFDFLMCSDCQFDDLQYTTYDPDGRVTDYVLDVTYSHLLKSLHKWIHQLVSENGTTILQDFGHWKFYREQFEFFLELQKEQASPRRLISLSWIFSQVKSSRLLSSVSLWTLPRIT